MACRCYERRTAIVRSAEALGRGDIAAAALPATAGFVVRTAAEDIVKAAQTTARLAAARAGLKR